MTKEVKVVFQDCVLCGQKGREKIAEYAEKGITIKKVSFVSEEGRELCFKAVNVGIKGMPFYTDGSTFATAIDTFLNEEKPQKKTKRKIRKEKKNGDISES